MIVGGVAALFMALAPMQSAFAETLTPRQLERIKANCQSIKSTLNQLHATDALLRVNRGQIYESMATKLMDRFNTRLTSNGLDATGTVAVTSSYRTALETFRSDYRSYERQLATAIRINCEQNPTEFHSALQEARTKRAKLNEDVVRLHRYIDDYSSAVNDFFINYQRVSGDN